LTSIEHPAFHLTKVGTKVWGRQRERSGPDRNLAANLTPGLLAKVLQKHSTHDKLAARIWEVSSLV